jgi:hypothetical protein
MTNGILNIIPGLQSTAMLGSTMGSMGFGRKRSSSRGQTKGFMRGAVTAMVGIPLIGATAGMIAGK